MRRIFFCTMYMLPALAGAGEWVEIPAGDFLMGGTAGQIEQGYRISREGYGHDGVRKAGWFDNEAPQKSIHLPAFRIQKTPVTQAEYAEFVRATDHPAPFVDEKTWKSYQLVHPYSRVKQYLWHQGRPPSGRENHPVVLVSFEDAGVYAGWLSKKTGRTLKLPSEAEWEKAMRGTDGRLYPWGDAYDPKRLNNADQGPFTTTPVGSFPAGASPYGVLDGSGNVFEWTRTDWSAGRKAVKGGSWDDHGGVCRPAAHHGRPATLKHILIGFRLVEEIE
ncbi:MAG: SUMF1/EgtB/PvdO family nonheme iron enzyme [Mariprofundaceae bacterium]|nr:SUMF1/EgtB/PvdO family nonheme iron enzyme [Mariprofundaceae bacterium]